MATIPDAPTIDNIIPRNNSAIVYFTPGLSDGGSSISHYLYSTDGANYLPAGLVSPFTIPSLSNGTLYHVTMKAVNSIGNSIHSNSENVTPLNPYQEGSPWPHNGGVSNTNSCLSPFQGPALLRTPLVKTIMDSVFISTPIIDNSGNIYVIHTGLNYDGNERYLLALNSSLNILWESSLTLLGTHGAPALSRDGLLYIGGHESIELHNGYLYAYNIYDTPTYGKLINRWRSVAIRGLKLNGPPSIGPDGTIYYVGTIDTTSSYLFAFDPCFNPVGDVPYKWSVQLTINTDGISNSSSPAFDASGIIYVPGGQNLYAFDNLSNLLWMSSNIGNNIYTSPVVGPDNHIYIATDTSLCAFFPHVETIFPVNPFWTIDLHTDVSPALTPDGYLVVATDTCLNIVNTINGDIEASLGIGFSTNPCVDICGNIFVGSPIDNTVYKINWNGVRNILTLDSSYTITNQGNLFQRKVHYSGDFLAPFTHGFDNAGFSLDANGRLYVSPMDEYGLNNTFYVFYTPIQPPQITNVTRGDGTAVIDFVPPVNTGDSPISYYLLETNGVLDTQTQYPGTNDQITVTGLTNTTSYTFFLYAVNQNGATSGQSNPGNLNVPCFKEDTKILTDKGYLPIQSLRKGDLVKTSRHGFVPIDTIGLRNLYHYKTPNRNPNVLYKCSQEKYPELFEDLIITGYHAILVDEFQPGEREKTLELLGDIYVTEGKYRLPACIDERTTIYEKEGDYKIYHIALENPSQYKNYGIYANGLLVETCSKRYLKEFAKMTLL